MTFFERLATGGISGAANYVSDWWNGATTEAATKPAVQQAEQAESDARKDNEAEAAQEAARTRPMDGPKVAAPESLEDARAKVDGIREHFNREVKPQVDAALNAGKEAVSETEHARVMKRSLEQNILSLRDQIEKIQTNAQAIIREADALKNEVTAIDDKLTLITQLRSRLQMQSNARGEVDLSQDRITKQLFQNAENLGILPPKSIEGMNLISKDRRDGFIGVLKDKADEIKRVRDGLNDQIQKKTKDAYKMVENYNECWKMLKKLIDDYYAILKKISQLMNGAR